MQPFLRTTFFAATAATGALFADMTSAEEAVPAEPVPQPALLPGQGEPPEAVAPATTAAPDEEATPGGSVPQPEVSIPASEAEAASPPIQPPESSVPRVAPTPPVPAASVEPPRLPAEPHESDDESTLRTGNAERFAHSRLVPVGLVFSGFTQAQYRRTQISEDQLDQAGQPLNRDEFALKTARFRVDAGYQFSAYSLELDARSSGGARVGVRRAEATVLYRGPDEENGPLIALSAGLIDIPFGYEVVESSRTRVFMERTVASEALFPSQMDAGFKAWGAFRFLRYSVGLVNGEPVESGSFPRDPNGVKDLVGRFGVEVPLGKAFRMSGGTSFSFGKGFHAGRQAVKDSVAWRDDNQDGVATPGEPIGVPGAAAAPSANFERWALGVDAQASWRTALGTTELFAEAVVASNQDRGLFVADPVVVGYDIRHVGFGASLVQGITPYALVGFRAATYDPNTDLFEQRRGAFTPRSLEIVTLAPVVGLVLEDRARLVFEYDFVRDALARDLQGVPTDLENDEWTLRLQVEL